MEYRTFQRLLLLIVGVIVGLGHLKMALRGMFVFRNEEPLSHWIFMFAGPLSTLPASVLAFFFPGIAGIWFIVGGVGSFATIVATVGGREDVTVFFYIVLLYTAPMILLGIFSLLLGKAVDIEVGRRPSSRVWLLSGGGLSILTVFGAWGAHSYGNSGLLILLLIAVPPAVGATATLVKTMVGRRALRRG